jgi:hypothetical protein
MTARTEEQEAHDLVPAAIAATIPPLYATEREKEPVAHIKLFTPDSSWTWYITEYDPKERLAFGLACGHEEELGYFSIDEMEKARGPLGLAVERDLHWKPKPLSQVQRRWQQGIAEDRGPASPEHGR